MIPEKGGYLESGEHRIGWAEKEKCRGKIGDMKKERWECRYGKEKRDRYEKEKRRGVEIKGVGRIQ